MLEKEVIDQMQSMCEQSLDPEQFQHWEQIKKTLKSVRKNLTAE